MNKDTKIVYEPPRILPLGELATGRGSNCQNGLIENTGGDCQNGSVVTQRACQTGGVAGDGCGPGGQP